MPQPSPAVLTSANSPETAFPRTLRTATESESVAKLLKRAAVGLGVNDRERLYALSARYSDYAAALRETVAAFAGPLNDPEQPALFPDGVL